MARPRIPAALRDEVFEGGVARPARALSPGALARGGGGSLPVWEPAGVGMLLDAETLLRRQGGDHAEDGPDEPAR
jgi:hypothetical protein